MAGAAQVRCKESALASVAPFNSPDEFSSEFVHVLHDHELELRTRLFKQWQESKNCDLILAAKGGDLRAHSCVVAAFSPKIRTLLENLPQISSAFSGMYMQLIFEYSVIRCLLNMMYTGVLSFNTSLLSSVMSAAKWLQMEEIVRICQDFKRDTSTAVKEEEEEVLTDENVLLQIDAGGDHQNNADMPKDDKEMLTSSVPVSHTKPQDLVPEGSSRRTKSNPAKSQEKINRSKRPRGRPRRKNLKQESPKKTNAQMDADGLMEDREETESDNTLNKNESKDTDATAEIKSNSKHISKKLSNNASASRSSRKRRTTKKLEEYLSLENKKGKARQNYRSYSSPSKTDSENSVLEKETYILAGTLLSHTELVEAENISKNDSAELNFYLGKIGHINCKKCLAKFTKVEDYHEHLNNHPTYSCDVCGMTYFRKSNLTRHLRTSHFTQHHLNCKRCNFVAKTESELRNHSKETHNESKPFSCEHPGCKYTTWKFDFLHRHAEIHSEVKRYICNKCGQGFSQHAGLMSHHRACYHLQQYLCDLCGQAFNHVQSMRAHRRTIHYGEKPFTCKVCSNPFSDQRNLKRHMRIHENAFPYQCQICKQKYRHSNSLKAHLKKHGDINFDADLASAISLANSQLSQTKSSSLSNMENKEDHSSSISDSLASVCNEGFSEFSPRETSLYETYHQAGTSGESNIVFPGQIQADLDENHKPKNIAKTQAPHSRHLASKRASGVQDDSSVLVSRSLLIENRRERPAEHSSTPRVYIRHHGLGGQKRSSIGGNGKDLISAAACAVSATPDGLMSSGFEIHSIPSIVLSSGGIQSFIDVQSVGVDQHLQSIIGGDLHSGASVSLPVVTLDTHPQNLIEDSTLGSIPQNFTVIVTPGTNTGGIYSSPSNTYTQVVRPLPLHSVSVHVSGLNHAVSGAPMHDNINLTHQTIGKERQTPDSDGDTCGSVSNGTVDASDSSGGAGSGQTRYGLDTLAEICFNSSQ